jgi:DNA-binding SARP family transcriptional activator
MVELCALGTLLIIGDDGTEIVVHGVQPKRVLILLMLNAQRVVPMRSLVDALWPGDPVGPPKSAHNIVQQVIRKLRSVLEPLSNLAIEQRDPGYMLRVDPECIDVHRFEALVAAADRDADDLRRADLLRQALELWRGEPLEDASGSAFDPVKERLARRRLKAIEDRIDADLRLGRHGVVVVELTELVREHPGHERFTEQLMLAQFRSGRAQEASQAYREHYRVLADLTGSTPSPRLGALLQRILKDDPALDCAAPEPVEARLDASSSVAGCLLFNDQLPRVAEVTDPTVLGVHLVPPLDGVDPADPPSHVRIPPYVPRDIDDELHRCLVSPVFAMVVGESTAGKSRTAFEAIRAVLPDHVLVAPQSRATIPHALAVALTLDRSVLWLDDLERFLGPGGLTRAAIARQLADDGCHRVVVATLGAVEDSRYCVPKNTEMLRDAIETLALARRFHLDRIFSSAERRRAREQAGHDSRIARSLAHADEYGLAEYMTAGPQLLRIWQSGWARGVHPRGAALVAAAVDCRRAGLTRPVDPAMLTGAADVYLDQRGGGRLEPEDEDRAWQWALEWRTGTTAMLSPARTGPGFVVFDYLVEATARATGPDSFVPEQVLEYALGHADAEEASRVGATAFSQGAFATAVAAFDSAYRFWLRDLGPEHPDTLNSRDRRAYALRVAGRPDDAVAEHRAVVAARIRMLGTQHPETLVSRNNLAAALYESGHWHEAEVEFRAVLDLRREVLPDNDPETIRTLSNHGTVLHNLGRWHEAEQQTRAAIAARTAVLGPRDRATLNSRNNLGLILTELGRYAEADAEHRVTLEARECLLGADHPETLESLNNHATVLRFQCRPEKAEEIHRLVADRRTRSLGPVHHDTIDAQVQLANDLLALGRADEAERLASGAAEQALQALGPRHPYTLDARDVHARGLAELGRHDAAIAELAEVIDALTATLGADHPYTLASRCHRVGAQAAAGDRPTADEIRNLHTTCRRLLGPDHPTTRALRALIGPV